MPNCPQWLLDANTENENVEISKFGYVVWRSGEWQGGEWRSGEWQGGDSAIKSSCTILLKENGKIKIGCKLEKTIEEWDLWFASSEEFYIRRGTKEFAMIHANYLAMKAYATFLKDFKSE